MNPEPEISVVIPLYNEESRLLKKFPIYIDYLKKNFPNYEIVLVNDGSRDRTRKLMTELQVKNPRIVCAGNEINRGRGYRMKEGALSARGKFILETDADLPVDPEYLGRFINYLKNNPEVSLIIGSRNLPGSHFVQNQTVLRILAAKIFHFLCFSIFRIKIKDVMCGFKLFRREAAKKIFAHVYDEKYLAAAEVVFVANKMGINMVELPISWEDNRDSRVKVFRATFITLKGMIQMFIRNLRGMYV